MCQTESAVETDHLGDIIPESESVSRERPHLVRTYKPRYGCDVDEWDEDDTAPMVSSAQVSTWLSTDRHSFSLSHRQLVESSTTIVIYQSMNLHPTLHLSQVAIKRKMERASRGM